MSKINLETLVNKMSELSKETDGKLNKSTAKEAVLLFQEAVKDLCNEHGSVALRGFGTFTKKHFEAREYTNPQTKEKSISKPYDALKFSSKYRFQ